MAGKTAAEWQTEIDALTTSISGMKAELEKRRARRGALALAATQGDRQAELELKRVADEIADLLWRIDVADLAIVEAQRHLQVAAAAEEDERIKAILAQRDEVEAQRDKLFGKLAKEAAKIVTLMAEAKAAGDTLYNLSVEAKQFAAAESYQRATRRAVQNIMLMTLEDAGLPVEHVRPEMRKQLRQVFGIGDN